MKPITEVDTQNESPEYWEEVLKSHGLGMTRGSDQNKIIYAGNLNDLARLEAGMYEKSTGRVRPKGKGPDC